MKNNKVTVIAGIALVCVILGFFVHYSFTLVAAILSIWGWRELTKK